MRDLLTNIKKAIEVLNKNKNLTIQLTDPNASVIDQVPIGVSIQEFEDSLHYILADLLFTADDLMINFDCTFDTKDLRAEEGNSTRYIEALQRIIKEIFERYKWAKNMGGAYVGLGSQTITGLSSGPYLNTGGWNLGSTTLQSGFSNLNVAGGLDVNGEINADDIKVNGGQLSVSSELNDLKQKNQALEAELDVLKAILKSKGVI